MLQPFADPITSPYEQLTGAAATLATKMHSALRELHAELGRPFEAREYDTWRQAVERSSPRPDGPRPSSVVAQYLRPGGSFAASLQEALDTGVDAREGEGSRQDERSLAGVSSAGESSEHTLKSAA